MLLKDFLTIYKKSMKGFKDADPVTVGNPTRRLSEGDLFVIYTTHLPVYGIVLKSSKNTIQFAYLTTYTALASVEAIGLKIDDLFEEVKLTHLVFETSVNNYIVPLKPVRKIDVVRENLERLKSITYGKIHEEFFETEKQRVQLILKLISEENIAYVPVCSLKVLRKMSRQMAIAATQKTTVRVNGAVIVKEDLGLRFYFSDQCEGRTGKIYLFEEIIYEGILQNGLLIRHLEGFFHHINEHTMKIEIDPESSQKPKERRRRREKS
ncbi:MAG: hypothetical protein WHT65_10355 [Pseudothermotoga sp.]